MSKIGVESRIDVTKLDKGRFYKGEKGTYCTMITFINLDEADQYGNHGFITQKKDKDEQGRLPILGNSKIFWKEQSETTKQEEVSDPEEEVSDPEDDVPF